MRFWNHRCHGSPLSEPTRIFAPRENWDVSAHPATASFTLAATFGLDWPTHLLAALLAVALVVLTDRVFQAWRGVSGIGEGDALLLAGLAAWLGPIPAIYALMMAGMLQLALSKLWSPTQKPFAPALAVGGWLIAAFMPGP